MDPKPTLNENLIDKPSGRNYPRDYGNGVISAFHPELTQEAMLKRRYIKIDDKIRRTAEGILVKDGYEFEVEYTGPTENNESKFLILDGIHNGEYFVIPNSDRGTKWDFYMRVKRGGKKTRRKTKKRHTRKRV